MLKIINTYGYNWWDYSVYADLRLVEDGYNTDNEVDSAYTGFKTLKGMIKKYLSVQ